MVLCLFGLLIPALALPTGTARGETLQEAYSRALREYYEGRYDKAIDSMERILAVPMEHEDLHYNLGCAYFRRGKLGPAIYHFERALILSPSSEDARFNLEAARAQAAARVTDELKGSSEQGLASRAVHWLPGQSLLIVFLVLWWLLFGVILVVRMLHPGPLRAGLFVGAGCLSIVALVFGLMLVGRAYEERRVTQGIVLSDQLPVREGPSEVAKPMFKLHAGFKVRVQASDQGWVRLRLPNGLEGWAPGKAIGTL